jgi:hypothetical protein
MRMVWSLVLAFALTWAPCGAAREPTRAPSVLFVGNSLTYVGNTPAVFDAIATANGVATSSDMIVRGGATLTQRVADGSIARALAKKKYSSIVLQERGGDFMCSFGPSSCVDSLKALGTIVSLAKKSGVSVYLLGTYQGNPKASKALVEAESDAARGAGIPYLEISERLLALRAAAPSLTWLAPDCAHPGAHLALLNAIIVHRAVFGQLPKPSSIKVNAPIYGANSGLTEALRGARDPAPLESTPRRIDYSAQSLRTILSALRSSAGS